MGLIWNMLPVLKQLKSLLKWETQYLVYQYQLISFLIQNASDNSCWIWNDFVVDVLPLQPWYQNERFCVSYQLFVFSHKLYDTNAMLYYLVTQEWITRSWIRIPKDARATAAENVYIWLDFNLKNSTRAGAAAAIQQVFKLKMSHIPPEYLFVM